MLSDVQVNIHLKDCRGVAVTGNTVWMGFCHNLLVEGCHSVVVGPNNFDRNPRYAYGESANAKNSLVFRNCEACTLTGLHVTTVRGEPAGLLLEDCRRMNLSGCTILDCDNVGLLAKNLADSRISDCLIRDDRPDAASTPPEGRRRGPKHDRRQPARRKGGDRSEVGHGDGEPRGCPELASELCGTDRRSVRPSRIASPPISGGTRGRPLAKSVTVG